MHIVQKYINKKTNIIFLRKKKNKEAHTKHQFEIFYCMFSFSSVVCSDKLVSVYRMQEGAQFITVWCS